MLGHNTGQLDIIDLMIYEQLIPEDHILREIDKTFDFTFVYDLVADKYSNIGRLSIDPLMLVKIFLLEYLYVLSDVKVIERAQTDMAFRWFLGLSIYDSVPDDTTLSYFRIHRLGLSAYDMIFDQIVLQCIDKKLVSSFRFQIDTTDVAANVNYPSDKKIIRQAYNRLIKEVKKFDVIVAKKSEDKLIRN